MAYKLLLADDSQTIQKVVELILNREGVDILACNDGEEAVRVFGSDMPDIVLADIEMPNLNGYQLCEKIKKNPATAYIPVILLAGAFEPFDEDYARSVGADDFIMKPFESHELVSKVKTLLAGPAEFEMPAVQPDVYEAPAAAVSAAEQATEWFEGYPSLQNETVGTEEPIDILSSAASPSEAEFKAFDNELQESMQKLELEGDIETAAPGEMPRQEMADGEISIEEISKMVKEAIGEPQVRPEKEAIEVMKGSSFLRETEKPVSQSHVEYDTRVAEPSMHSATISKEEINAAVLNSVNTILPSVVRDSVERAVSHTLPDLLEEALRQSIKEMSGHIRDSVNAEIRKVVPSIADSIIKQEIEKITSGLS